MRGLHTLRAAAWREAGRVRRVLPAVWRAVGQARHMQKLHTLLPAAWRTAGRAHHVRELHALPAERYCAIPDECGDGLTRPAARRGTARARCVQYLLVLLLHSARRL